ITAKLPEKGGHYHNIKEERKKNIWIALKNENIPYIDFILDRVDNRSNAEINKEAILEELLNIFDFFCSKDQSRPVTYINNRYKPQIQKEIKNITTEYCPYLYQYGTSMGSIQVVTRIDNDNLFISFTDNGCGIEKDKLTNIFDLFFPDTGRGLSLIYRIIKEHDGDITADSTPGKGTTMTIRLPLNKK
ncbi:MAG: hypothetical protein GY730_02065, partial [bacterium]|nr:hypothetical protein [bacterium]